MIDKITLEPFVPNNMKGSCVEMVAHKYLMEHLLFETGVKDGLLPLQSSFSIIYAQNIYQIAISGFRKNGYALPFQP